MNVWVKPRRSGIKKNCIEMWFESKKFHTYPLSLNRHSLSAGEELLFTYNTDRDYIYITNTILQTTKTTTTTQQTVSTNNKERTQIEEKKKRKQQEKMRKECLQRFQFNKCKFQQKQIDVWIRQIEEAGLRQHCHIWSVVRMSIQISA